MSVTFVFLEIHFQQALLLLAKEKADSSSLAQLCNRTRAVAAAALYAVQLFLFLLIQRNSAAALGV